MTKTAKARSSGSESRTAKSPKGAMVVSTPVDSSASVLIDQRINELGGWRGETLARMRSLILDADSKMIEQWKWNTPVWSHDGIVCTGEAYKDVVKLTFAHGAKIADPSKLFNSSLEGNTRRAIDIQEGEKVNAIAFKSLIKAAVAHNGSSEKAKPATKVKKIDSSAKATRPAMQTAEKKVVLLSGDNPQIAKADGDAPVQAYIAAIPGWKQDIVRRFDALVVKIVPEVSKAVRWNSPFYGFEGQGWFLSLHCFTKYVKVTFFHGTSLSPLPPGASKHPEVRYLDIYEKHGIDESQAASWIKQAAALPGWIP